MVSRKKRGSALSEVHKKWLFLQNNKTIPTKRHNRHRKIMDASDFKMVAKTMKGLEAVLADELRGIGAKNVVPGFRMVSFEGDLEILYKANLCLRTALRVLKPFYTFKATNPDELYDRVKEFDWSSIMTDTDTFAIDTVSNSDTFTHSRYATYRVKDAIADWFRDRYDRRPGVRIHDADIVINVHINNESVTLSLDSSGESLHKRGWRVATTEAPINEVLAAGILLMSGYDGSQPFVDPMCGSGTFLVEAALIAANIHPGVFRRNYAFQKWRDYDEELFERLWNDDEGERVPQNIIAGADILPAAVEVAKRNLRAAGVSKYVNVEVRRFSEWTEAPAPAGIMVTNPPYGERISAPDMEELYAMIGSELKKIFTGWNVWIISLKEEFFRFIGLAPSQKISLLNGSLDCELREYVMFKGNKKDFRAGGGRLKEDKKRPREEKPVKRSPMKSKKPLKRTEPAEKSRKKAPVLPEINVEASADNPLASRRNPDALKAIMNRAPSLPVSEGPIMRTRDKRKKTVR